MSFVGLGSHRRLKPETCPLDQQNRICGTLSEQQRDSTVQIIRVLDPMICYHANRSFFECRLLSGLGRNVIVSCLPPFQKLRVA